MTKPQEACNLIIRVTEVLNCDWFVNRGSVLKVQQEKGNNLPNSVPRGESIFRKDFTQRQN